MFDSMEASVSTPKQAKGLEFDAVVVVEPRRIVEEELGDARALYVALTRSVQELIIVSSSRKASAFLGI